jgi:hypothetical protein
LNDRARANGNRASEGQVNESTYLRRIFSRGRRAAVEKRTGAAPAIRYFDLQMLLDNEVGTVTEWSKTGEKTVRTALDIADSKA